MSGQSEQAGPDVGLTVHPDSIDEVNFSPMNLRRKHLRTVASCLPDGTMVAAASHADGGLGAAQVMIVTATEVLMYTRDGQLKWSMTLSGLSVRAVTGSIKLVSSSGEQRSIRTGSMINTKLAERIRAVASAAPDTGRMAMTVVAVRGTDAIAVGDRVGMHLDHQAVMLFAQHADDPLLVAGAGALREFSVDGPGAMQEGGGFWGGGFGVDGAVRGMAIANWLNKMTTQVRTETYVRIATDVWNVVMLSVEVDPVVMRTLAPVIAAPPPASAPAEQAPLATQLRELGELHQAGIIDDAEFAAAKRQLLGGA